MVLSKLSISTCFCLTAYQTLRERHSVDRPLTLHYASVCCFQSSLLCPHAYTRHCMFSRTLEFIQLSFLTFEIEIFFKLSRDVSFDYHLSRFSCSPISKNHPLFKADLFIGREKSKTLVQSVHFTLSIDINTLGISRYQLEMSSSVTTFRFS